LDDYAGAAAGLVARHLTAEGVLRIHDPARRFDVHDRRRDLLDDLDLRRDARIALDRFALKRREYEEQAVHA
jgi:hypothetical protein